MNITRIDMIVTVDLWYYDATLRKDTPLGSVYTRVERVYGRESELAGFHLMAQVFMLGASELFKTSVRLCHSLHRSSPV